VPAAEWPVEPKLIRCMKTTRTLASPSDKSPDLPCAAFPCPRGASVNELGDFASGSHDSTPFIVHSRRLIECNFFKSLLYRFTPPWTNVRGVSAVN
jgi:hypothetical protein